MLDHFQYPLEEAERHPPDDMTIGLSDDDARETDTGQLGNDMLDLPRRLVEPCQGKPERLLNLRGVEGEYLMLLEMKGMRRHNEARGDTLVPDVVVDLPQILGIREFDTDLFEGFAGCRHAARIVPHFHATARKGHMAGPRIALEDRSLDQQNLGGIGPIAQDDRHRGTIVVGGCDELRGVAREFLAYVSDIHGVELSDL